MFAEATPVFGGAGEDGLEAEAFDGDAAFEPLSPEITFLISLIHSFFSCSLLQIKMNVLFDGTTILKEFGFFASGASSTPVACLRSIVPFSFFPV